MERLAGKTAIITGAAGGLGKAMAAAFAQEGANVVMTDCNETALARAREELHGFGENILALTHDVSKEEDWQRVLATAEKTYGKVNIVVNNAGFLPHGSVEQETLEGMHRGFAALVDGVFLGMQMGIAYMKKCQEPCAILNVSSVCGAYVATEDNFTYNTAKSAVVGMTRAAAVDLAGSNIRVNTIHPGTIKTAINKQALEGRSGRIKLSKIPLGRMGEPQEVAWAAVFLCSDEASYIHGTSLVIDGGQILGYRNPDSFETFS